MISARSAPAFCVKRWSDSMPPVAMPSAVKAVANAAAANARARARGDQHEREQQRQLRLDRQGFDEEAGQHRPPVDEMHGERRARRGQHRVLPVHRGDEHTRAREQREPADAFRAGRRREPRHALYRYPEQHDAERDEQRIADRIGQQREGATTSRYVGDTATAGTHSGPRSGTGRRAPARTRGHRRSATANRGTSGGTRTRTP